MSALNRFAVVHARQLVAEQGSQPRRGQSLREISLIPDGAMIVSEGRIEWVGPTDAMPDRQLEAIDVSGHLVTPGFVDAHTHCVFAEPRCEEFKWRCEGQSYQDIARQGGGIRSSMATTRAASDAGLLQSIRRHYRLLLREGTTAWETKSGYGLSVEHEVRSLQLAEQAANEVFGQVDPNVSLTFLGAHAVPPEFDGDATGYLQTLIHEALPNIPDTTTGIDAFVEEGYFEPEELRAYLRAGQEKGLNIRLHVDQLRESSGAEFAASLGATSADHLEYTSDAGMQALLAAGTTPVLLPGSVYGLGLSRYPDARRMIEIGLPIVLATDFNPGSSPVFSLPWVMGLSCRMMKLSPAETFHAATINAAHSLGVADKLGSLEPGKQADFVVWDAERFEELSYWVPPPRTNAVFVQGKRMVPVEA